MKNPWLRVCCSLIILLIAPTSLILAKDSDDEQRLKKAADVLGEIINIPDNIPQDLLDKAECVIVLPSVKKFAIGIGGNYGKGAMVCRTGAQFDGPWGPPAAMRLEGASIGLQLGGSATDFVLLIMNPKGAESLLAIVNDVLELTDLAYKRDALVTSLSRGMTQRLGLADDLLEGALGLPASEALWPICHVGEAIERPARDQGGSRSIRRNTRERL